MQQILAGDKIVHSIDWTVVEIQPCPVINEQQVAKAKVKVSSALHHSYNKLNVTKTNQLAN